MPTPTLPRTPSLPLTTAWLARHDAASLPSGSPKARALVATTRALLDAEHAARVRLGVSPDVSAVRL